ncbi:helix-turn-helix-domain containing protein, AraC type [Shewanella sediminis HAW-EB3]|uniref:Helix-turn-helix-domain containing protein, AraC type n=2 Tax=Shewanella sediminis TaxID=271097 RepID=A8FR39_SHESH|nr:helix-turn-helix-domain containing protein, AraC type [Shewanella sediminis HAW-EB3]
MNLMQGTAKYTTIAAWASAVARALRASGVDPESVYEDAGLSLTEIERAPDSRIPIENMTLFWEAVESATQSPAFGLAVGRYAYPMHFRSLGLLMMTSETLARAFERLPDYYALVSNSASIKLQRTPQLIGFTITPLNGIEISEMAIDAFFATLMHHGELMIGHSNFIKTVELIRESPKDESPWQTCFNCPVSFEQQVNCLWMDRSMLEKATMMADPKLAMKNEHAVRQYLEKMQALSWHEKTSQAVHAMLVDGEPCLVKAAQIYNLSERTLSRYLKSEGTNFRTILQEKRKELAHYYLINSELSITQVADKLGYTSLSNFTRVFHLWYGLSPSLYRLQSHSSANL